MPAGLIRAWEARRAKLKHCSNPKMKVGLGRDEQNGPCDETIQDNLDIVGANGRQVQFVSGLAGISQPSPMGHHQQRQQPMRNPSITIRLGARTPDNRNCSDMANATSKVQIKHFAVPRHFDAECFVLSTSPFPPKPQRATAFARSERRWESIAVGRRRCVRAPLAR